MLHIFYDFVAPLARTLSSEEQAVADDRLPKISQSSRPVVGRGRQRERGAERAAQTRKPSDFRTLRNSAPQYFRNALAKLRLRNDGAYI